MTNSMNPRVDRFDKEFIESIIKKNKTQYEKEGEENT